MNRFINAIKRIFSYKGANTAILLVSIVSRIIQSIFFFNTGVDRCYQILATQSLVHGHGISTSKVLPGDLSGLIYIPLIKWPPGYSLLLSPFYALSGNDYILSSLFLDIVFAVVLIFVSRAILKLLDTPLYLVNIYTLVTGFFIYYFYFITFSDAIATTFFITGIYYTLLFLKTRLHWAKAVTLITVFLFLSAFMKYMLMPVVFVIPVFLIIKAIADKNKRILKTGILSFSLLAIAMAMVLLYQKNISGSASYVSDAARGFFPSNLLSAYPLIPGSIIKPDTLALLLNEPAAGIHILHLFQLIYILFIAAFIFFSIWLLNRYRLKKMTLATDFICLTIAISVSTVLILGILSVRIAKGEELPGYWWTFIQEPRYYGLPNFLIHLAIFTLYQFYQNKKTTIFRYAMVCLFLLLMPEMFRGIIFTSKRVINFNKENYSWQSELELQKYAARIIENAQQKYHTRKVVVTGSSYYVNIRISLYSNIPILELVDLNKSNNLIKSKEPVLLLIVLNEKISPGIQSYWGLTLNKPIGYLNGFSFYVSYIPSNP